MGIRAVCGGREGMEGGGVCIGGIFRHDYDVFVHWDVVVKCEI